MNYLLIYYLFLSCLGVCGLCYYWWRKNRGLISLTRELNEKDVGEWAILPEKRWLFDEFFTILGGFEVKVRKYKGTRRKKNGELHTRSFYELTYSRFNKKFSGWFVRRLYKRIEYRFNKQKGIKKISEAWGKDIFQTWIKRPDPLKRIKPPDPLIARITIKGGAPILMRKPILPRTDES